MARYELPDLDYDYGALAPRQRRRKPPGGIEFRAAVEIVRAPDSVEFHPRSVFRRLRRQKLLFHGGEDVLAETGGTRHGHGGLRIAGETLR